MKLYRTYVTVLVEEGMDHVRWSGSQADAAKDRKYFNSDLKIPRDRIHTDEVDVPTDKKGLLAFLNQRGA